MSDNPNIAIEKAVGIIYKWGRMTKEEMHSAVEDKDTLKVIRSQVRDTANLILDEEPVAIKEGIDCNFNEQPTGNASADAVINTKLLERKAALFASRNGLRISQLAVKVLQAGIHRILCEDVIHSHYIASRRWKQQPPPKSNFAGLSLIISASENWCNGNATPHLKMMLELGGISTAHRSLENHPEDEQQESEPEIEEEEDGCPYRKEDLINYLECQLKVAAFRSDALREMVIDSSCEASSTRYASVEVAAEDNEALLSELLDDPHLSSNKKHPIWSYVYEALEQRISDRISKKRRLQEEAAENKRLKEQQERDTLAMKKQQARTTREILGVKRGILVRKVRQIRKGDVTTAQKMRIT